MFSAACAIVLAANLATNQAPKQLAESGRDTYVVVFRHHPGYIDTQARMRARVQDESVILKALDKNRIGLEYEGGLGHRGFTLRISRNDVGQWKAMIDELHKGRRLTYYTQWGLNERGFGLAPISRMDYDSLARRFFFLVTRLCLVTPCPEALPR
jgi:hypothetical protein